VDLINGRVAHEIASPLDRHYYGHGIFSTDGARLYSTENDFATGRGVIGIYDANDNYRRLGEIASHGIGPHELRMLADGKTLVVANGGIRTHPDLGRSKLNLKDMDPLLAYVDSADGALRGSCRPPASHHQLSVRHLAVTNDEAVCIAMQFEGPANIHPPLVAIHRRDQPLKLLLAPPGIQERLRNYCGSVCCDSSGTCFAVSSPRGNLITFWTSAGEYVDCLQLEDGCGIAAHEEPGHFWISSGQGRLVCHSIIEGAKQELRLHPVSATRWDNHLATGLVA
jgi:hypothetical protein